MLNESGTNKHRLLTAKSNNSNILISYGYNTKGSVNSVTVSSSGTTKKIVTTAEYGGTNYNELRSETDPLGNKTSYAYNSSRSTLSSITDSAGNKTQYTYNDKNDNLTSVSAGGATITYNYNANRSLKSIVSPTATYNFTYDKFMNPSTVSIGTQTLSANTYEAENGNLKKSEYGNGSSVSYDYDDLDRITQKTYNNSAGSTVQYKWTYNGANQTASAYDSSENRTYHYNYDLSGRLIEVARDDGAYIRTSYSDKNLSTGISYKYGGTEENVSFIYNEAMDNAQEKATFTNGSSYMSGYDALGRSVMNAIYANNMLGLITRYSYLDNSSDSSKTSGLVSEITYNTDDIDDLQYEYDSRGNITGITYGELVEDKYSYDSLNQLVLSASEDTGEGWVYAYDKSGNITSKKKYICNYSGTDFSQQTPVQTITYTYGDANWKDKLTAYNGKTITYDSIGNMLTFDGQTFSWNGRRMMSYTKSGATSTYKYNGDGIRTTKTTGGITTKYLLNGSTILLEDRGGNVISYYYDANGTRIAFKYNGTMYYYVYNLQGDVTHIVKSDKSVVGTYKYDPWGRIVNLGSLTSIAQINPFRYRGYYYDTESNLYYLNSRYYNPEIGRFINADNQLTAGSDMTGINLFAYCGNNPVNRTDATGCKWYHWVIGGAIVAGCAVATVLTAGGFAAAVGAVAAVGSGTAAATTVSTIAAGAFIGSAAVYGMAAVSASLTSSTPQEFAEKGNWGTVAATAGGAVLGGAGAYVSTKISSTSPKTNQAISRGSTGRTQPVNLREQLAMEQVKSNPSAGQRLDITMNDPRWPVSEGWIKMQQIVPTSQGNINIHYVYNQTLKIFDDFKFK